jgi:tetratricopeptide (TPR) repeat protein
MTEPAYVLTLGCLARARVAYDTVVGVLSSTPESRLSNAIVAARGLPALENCALESSASPIAPPPAAIGAQVAALASEVERARVLATTDDPNSIALTKAALPRAEALGYTPLVARAYLAHGLALLGQQQPDVAIPMLDRAALAATDALDDPTFVEAFARGVYARSTSGQASTSAAPTRDDFAERVALRSGTAGAFARALLFNNLGAAALAGGDRERARTWFDRALAETAARDRDAELLFAFTNRALVADDPAERERLFEQGRIGMTRLLGAKHRKTLEMRFMAVQFVADPRVVAVELAEVCALFERYHVEVASATLASCHYELGSLALDRGDEDAARAALLRVDDGDGPMTASARAQLILLDGKPAEAAASARAVAQRFATQSWARLFAADAYRFAATCEAQLGRRTAALADARAALALFDQLGYLGHMARYQRTLAHTRALLARLAPANEATRFAEQAAQWYRAAGGYDDRLRELATVGSR